MQTNLHLNSNYRNIPSEYQQVAYHDAMGYSTCNTGYTVKQNTVVETKFKLSNLSSIRSYIGCGNPDSSSYPIRIYSTTSSGTTRLNCIRLGRSKEITGVEEGDEYTIILREGAFIINGTSYTASASVTGINTTIPLGIGGYMPSTYNPTDGLNHNSSTGNPSEVTYTTSARSYYTRIWEEEDGIDKLIHDYVPCYRRSDFMCGWYDIVTDTFIYPENVRYAEQGALSGVKVYYHLIPGPHVYSIPYEYRQLDGITLPAGTAYNLFTIDTTAIARVLIGVRYDNLESGTDQMGCSNFTAKMNKSWNNYTLTQTGCATAEQITGDIRSKYYTISSGAYGTKHSIIQLCKAASTDPGNSGQFSIGGVTGNVAATSLVSKHISFVEHYGVSNGQLRPKQIFVACERIIDKKFGFYELISQSFTTIPNASITFPRDDIKCDITSHNYLNGIKIANGNTSTETNSGTQITKISNNSFIINSAMQGYLYRIKYLGLNGITGNYSVSFTIYKDVANENDDISFSCDLCDSGGNFDKNATDLSGYYISCIPQRKSFHARAWRYHESSSYNGFLDFMFTTSTSVKVYVSDIKITETQLDDFNSFRNQAKLGTTVLSNQGTLTYDSTENGYYIQNADSYVKTTFNTISGHKYYIQFDHKWNISSANTIYIYQGAIATTALGSVTTTDSQGWEQIKKIFTATENSIIYIGKKGLASTTKTYYRNMFMIDITGMNDVSSNITENDLSEKLPMHLQDSGFLRAGTGPNNNALVKLYEVGGIKHPSSIYDRNIYYEPDGSAWIHIAHQKNVSQSGNPTNLFASGDCRTARQYVNENAWLDSLALHGCIARWELLVKKKLSSTTSETIYRWVQYKNPLLSTYNDINGYIKRNSSTRYSTEQYGGLYWRASSGQHLVADNNVNNNWYGICGYKTHQGGTPGFFTGVLTTGYQDLYLRIDKSSYSAFDFNGKSSVIRIDEPLKLYGTHADCAVAFWLKLDPSTATNTQIVYFDNRFGSLSMLKITATTSNCTFYIASNQSYQSSTINSIILSGFNHIIVAKEGSAYKLYFNGQLINTGSSTSATGVVGQSNALYIGNANNGYSAAAQPYFKGCIADFKLITGITNDSDALKFYNKELNKYK